MPDMPSAQLRARVALEKAGFSAAHSLGQNFILDERLLAGLLDAAEVSGVSNALEIGPGCGVMTSLLSDRCARVLAVELDERLAPVLADVLSGRDNVTVRFGDFLKLRPEDVAPAGFDLTDYIVVANLPYYITSDILVRLIESEYPPKRIVIMVQREAAERILSRPGEKAWCALAAIVWWYGDAKVVAEVPRTAFEPRPHVDSAFLSIRGNGERGVSVRDEKLFFRTVRAAFAMRRKKLTNNLKAAFGLTQQQAERILLEEGLDPNVRGEALGVDQLCRLANRIGEYKNTP